MGDHKYASNDNFYSLVLKYSDYNMMASIPAKSSFSYTILYSLLMIIMAFLSYVTLNYADRPIDIFQRFSVLFSIDILGWLVVSAIFRVYLNYKVNYTRKIIHCLTCSMSFVVDYFLFLRDATPFDGLWEFFICLLLPTLCTIPIRKKIGVLNIIHYAMERPEDRPHTWEWFFIQVVTSFIVLVPLMEYWTQIGKASLRVIPLMIVTLGDGLAEPIGIRFGKNNKYQVTAWTLDDNCLKFINNKKKIKDREDIDDNNGKNKKDHANNKRVYYRSVAGSLTVWFFGIVGVWLANQKENTFDSSLQYIVALVIVPIVGAVSEAYSPHTLDNAVMIFFAGLAVSLIECLV